jgi:hypothetical protein
MKKTKIGVYLPDDHPIMQIKKGKRATAIYDILDDWYKREQRLKNMEELLRQIDRKLAGGATSQIKPTPDQEAIMDEVLKDILNMGKKGGSS